MCNFVLIHSKQILFFNVLMKNKVELTIKLIFKNI